jgi:hypothetical protein
LQQAILSKGQINLLGYSPEELERFSFRRGQLLMATKEGERVVPAYSEREFIIEDVHEKA